MNFAIAPAVFPVIFIGELPDKTMFASLVLSTRGRPLPVWAGAAAAFTVHVVIAVSIGVALFRLLPHRVLGAIVAFMFAAGAVLAIAEARRERNGRQASKVGAGALLALWSVAALAVVSGTSLLRWVNITAVRIVTAVILTGLAAVTAWLAIR